MICYGSRKPYLRKVLPVRVFLWQPSFKVQTNILTLHALRFKWKVSYGDVIQGTVGSGYSRGKKGVNEGS